MANDSGKLREQNISQPNPATVLVASTDGTFKGIMKINKDAFDKKQHKIVNEHGQELDENGAVKPAPAPVAEAGTNSAAGTKTT